MKYEFYVNYSQSNLFSLSMIGLLCVIIAIYKYKETLYIKKKYNSLINISLTLSFVLGFIFAYTNEPFSKKIYFVKAIYQDVYQEKKITQEQYNILINTENNNIKYVVDEVVGDLGDLYYNRVNVKCEEKTFKKNSDKKNSEIDAYFKYKYMYQIIK